MTDIKYEDFLENKNIGFFRFKRFNNDFLLTSEIGDYLFLKRNDFLSFIHNRAPKTLPFYSDLREKGFIRDKTYLESQVEGYRQKNMFLWKGPVLHIIVLTLRCNYGCSYCQSSSQSSAPEKYDMDKDTARKVVDLIFESPSRSLTIEFQGGEPLLNFEALSFVVDYAIEKSMASKKNIRFSLVTNLSFLSQDMLNYLREKNVDVCTSLDGPAFLHNKQRFFINSRKGTYSLTVKKINEIKKKAKHINALLTITKQSLKYPRRIIDEYVKYGFSEIHLRPLTCLGRAKEDRQRLGYTAQEFLDFYSEAMDYLISLNLKGKAKLKERLTRYLLIKILSKNDPNYLDLRSPCGAGIGQILYNYNGEVYTCDEARMLGNELFRIGDAKKDSYSDILKSPAVYSCCLASTLDSLGCDYCAYKPYCGVCPVVNYAENGNLFLLAKNRCKMNRGILDYIFGKLKKDSAARDIFKQWAQE